MKRKNGNRIWSQDLGKRILLPLSHWGGDLPVPRHKAGRTMKVPQHFDLVMVVPHPGRTMQVLDVFDGKSLASASLDAAGSRFQGEFVSEPAVLEDGRIVIPVQKYEESDASLLILGVLPVVDRDETTGKEAGTDGGSPGLKENNL